MAAVDTDGHFLASRTAMASGPVLHAARGCFAKPQSVELVLGRESSLELLREEADGTMTTLCEQILGETIADMVALPCISSSEAGPVRDLLLVLCAGSGIIAVSAFDSQRLRFVALQRICAAQPASWPSTATGAVRRSARQPLGRLIAAHSRGDAVAAIVSAPGSSTERVSVFTAQPDSLAGSVLSPTPIEGTRLDMYGQVLSLTFLDDGQPSSSCGPPQPGSAGPVLAVLSVLYRAPASILNLIGLRRPTAGGPEPGSVLWSRAVRLELPRRALLPLMIVAIPGSGDALLLLCANGAALVHADRSGANSDGAPPSSFGACASADGCSGLAALAGAVDMEGTGTSNDVVAMSQDDAGDTLAGSTERPGVSDAVAMCTPEAPVSHQSSPADATADMADAQGDVTMALDDAPFAPDVSVVTVYVDLPEGPAALAWAPGRESSRPRASRGFLQQPRASTSGAWGGPSLPLPAGADEPRLYLATYSRPEDLLVLQVAAGGTSLLLSQIRVESPSPAAWAAAAPLEGGGGGGGGPLGSCTSLGASSGRSSLALVHPVSPRAAAAAAQNPPRHATAGSAYLEHFQQLKRRHVSALAALPGDRIAVFRYAADGGVLQMEPALGFESTGSGVALHAKAVGEPIVNCAPLHGAAQSGASVVAACGGLGSSLKIFTRGLNAPTLLVTPPTFPAATGVWAMSAEGPQMGVEAAPHSLLVVSFVTGTRALALGDSDWVDLSEGSGLDTEQSTLAAGVLHVDGCPSPIIVQVTQDGVRFASFPSADCPARLLALWRPPPPPPGLTSPGRGPAQGEVVTVAAVCTQGVLVALAHVRVLVLLRPALSHAAAPGGGAPGITVDEIASFDAPAELSCLGVEGQHWDGEPICLVGTYVPALEVLSLAPGRELSHLATCPLSSPGEPGSDSLSGASRVPESCFATAWGPAGPGAGPQLVESSPLLRRGRPLILVGMRAGELLEIDCDGTRNAGAANASASAAASGGTGSGSGAPADTAEAWRRASADCPRAPVPPGTVSAAHWAAEESSGGEFASTPPRRGGWSAQSPRAASIRAGGLHPAPAVLAVRRARHLGEAPARIVPLTKDGLGPVAVLSDRPWLFQAASGVQSLSGAPVAAPHARHGVALRVPGAPPGFLMVEADRLRLIAAVDLRGSPRCLTVSSVPLGDLLPSKVAVHSPSGAAVVGGLASLPGPASTATFAPAESAGDGLCRLSVEMRCAEASWSFSVDPEQEGASRETGLTPAALAAAAAAAAAVTAAAAASIPSLRLSEGTRKELEAIAAGAALPLRTDLEIAVSAAVLAVLGSGGLAPLGGFLRDKIPDDDGDMEAADPSAATAAMKDVLAAASAAAANAAGRALEEPETESHLLPEQRRSVLRALDAPSGRPLCQFDEFAPGEAVEGITCWTLPCSQAEPVEVEGCASAPSDAASENSLMATGSEPPSLPAKLGSGGFLALETVTLVAVGTSRSDNHKTGRLLLLELDVRGSPADTPNGGLLSPSGVAAVGAAAAPFRGTSTPFGGDDVWSCGGGGAGVGGALQEGSPSPGGEAAGAGACWRPYAAANLPGPVLALCAVQPDPAREGFLLASSGRVIFCLERKPRPPPEPPAPTRGPNQDAEGTGDGEAAEGVAGSASEAGWPSHENGLQATEGSPQAEVEEWHRAHEHPPSPPRPHGAQPEPSGPPGGRVPARRQAYCLRVVSQLRLRHAVTSLAAHGDWVAVGDAADGAHLLRVSSGGALDLVHSDAAQRSAAAVAIRAQLPSGARPLVYVADAESRFAALREPQSALRGGGGASAAGGRPPQQLHPGDAGGGEPHGNDAARARGAAGLAAEGPAGDHSHIGRPAASLVPAATLALREPPAALFAWALPPLRQARGSAAGAAFGGGVPDAGSASGWPLPACSLLAQSPFAAGMLADTPPRGAVLLACIGRRGTVELVLSVSQRDWDALHAAEIALAAHPLTQPLLGGVEAEAARAAAGHTAAAGRSLSSGRCFPRPVVNCDLLLQLLELSADQQRTVLSGPRWTPPPEPMAPPQWVPESLVRGDVDPAGCAAVDALLHPRAPAADLSSGAEGAQAGGEEATMAEADPGSGASPDLGLGSPHQCTDGADTAGGGAIAADEAASGEADTGQGAWAPSGTATTADGGDGHASSSLQSAFASAAGNGPVSLGPSGLHLSLTVGGDASGSSPVPASSFGLSGSLSVAVAAGGPFWTEADIAEVIHLLERVAERFLLSVPSQTTPARR